MVPEACPARLFSETEVQWRNFTPPKIAEVCKGNILGSAGNG
jgi:hypothetical protein